MRSPGLYIHVPFCGSKCPYCDFYSISPAYGVTAWLGALKKEVHLYRDRFGPFESLYLGGGTPSVLGLDDLGALMDCLFENFEFAPNTEITIEANPGDVTVDFIAAVEAIGFNRVSLGVQSFDDRELAFLGRRHSAAEAAAALERLSASGIGKVGIDLIYGLGDGLDGQSLDGWMRTLERTLRYDPEHISCYQLTIAGGTPFGQMKEEGRITSLSEERGRAFFLATARLLGERGYLHYEISNFSHGEDNRSRHNSKYWDHSPYLGLGPSAHSFQGSRRWWNIRSVAAYVEALEEGRAQLGGEETLTEEQLRLEALSLGLRTSRGVALSEVPEHPELSDVLSSLQASGHVRIEGGRILPTTEGFLVADRLPLSLLP
ncbi:radical SAM family heme chaperone HemW [Thermodesulfobacteriota bacterium]